MWQLASAGLVLATIAQTRSAQGARSVTTEQGIRAMSAPPARHFSLGRSRWPPNERAHPSACAGPRSSRTSPPTSVSVQLGRSLWPTTMERTMTSARVAPIRTTRRVRATLGARAAAPTSPPVVLGQSLSPTANARLRSSWTRRRASAQLD